MNLFMLSNALTMFLTTGGSADNSTIAGILASAGEIVTWVITQMGSFLGFVTDHPIILVLFLFTLVGFSVGMLMRIWRSVG